MATDKMSPTPRNFLRDVALPLWSEAGFHQQTGMFLETLTPDKNNSSQFLRLRVQARQIYVFACAAKLGWADKRIAQKGASFLLAYGKAAHGGFINLFDDKARIKNDKVVLYDQAFVLLALAALYEVDDIEFAERQQYLDEALKLCDFLDDKMAHKEKGYCEALPFVSSFRRQNPHMHLFEAFCALYKATKNAYFLNGAKKLFGLFERYFLVDGRLLEFFNEDFTPAPKAGQQLEAGHFFEWVYLLDGFKNMLEKDLDISPTSQTSKTSKTKNTSHTKTQNPEPSKPQNIPLTKHIKNIQNQLFDFAWEKGRNQIGFAVDKFGANEFGANEFGADEFGADEMVCEAQIASSRSPRLWPQTEMLKALLVLGKTQEAEKLTEKIFSHYLNVSPFGLWRDRPNEDDKAPFSCAPASSFYHLWEAFLLC